MPPLALSNHPVDVGQRSEAAILAAFVERRFMVWLPWSVNHRYDMLLDVFMVACEATGRARGSLRVDPTANGQNKRVLWAADHRLESFTP
jgi:hypothetical protein